MARIIAGRMTGRVLGSNVITGSYGYFIWNTPNGAGRLSSANYTGSIALEQPLMGVGL